MTKTGLWSKKWKTQVFLVLENPERPWDQNRSHGREICTWSVAPRQRRNFRRLAETRDAHHT